MSTYNFGADLAIAATMPGLRLSPSVKINIGVLAPLSGMRASWGLPGFHACQMWCDQVNASGGLKIGLQQHLVQIIPFDDAYDPECALIGAKELVNEHDVKILLMLGGDTVPNIIDFLSERKVLATTLLPSDLSPDAYYLIAPCEVHPLYLVVGVEWLAKAHPEYKTAVICAQADALGLPSIATYRAAFEAANIALIDEVIFEVDEFDAEAIIAQFMKQSPDIVCLDTIYTPFVDEIVEVAFQRGYKPQFLSCTCDNYQSLVERTNEEYMEGFVFHFPDFNDPALLSGDIRFSAPEKFFDQFNALFPNEWSAVPWEYYSILELWRYAVESAQTTEASAVLHTMKTDGLSFNVFGDARWWGQKLFGIDNALVGSWPIVRIEKGRAKIVEFGDINAWLTKYETLLVEKLSAQNQLWHQRYQDAHTIDAD